MKWQKIRSFVGSHRLAVAVGFVSLLLVALIAAYVLWSINAWAKYETSYSHQSEAIRKEVEAALALPANNAEERQKKNEALRAVADRMTTLENEACKMPKMAKWQGFIDLVQSHKDKCNEWLGKVQAFNSELKKTISYLEKDEKLAKIITSVSTAKNELDNKEWAAQMTSWKKAKALVETLPADGAFVPVKTQATEVVGKVSAAWGGVMEAHKKEDAGAYKKAKEQLSEAYKKMPTIAVEGKKQFQKLTESLRVAYVVAFK